MGNHYYFLKLAIRVLVDLEVRNKLVYSDFCLSFLFDLDTDCLLEDLELIAFHTKSQF